MILITLDTSPAQATFTPPADGNYRMVITGGCSYIVDNCVATGKGMLQDNTTQNQANATAFGYPSGSGITNDGLMGVIDFKLAGGSISVNTFSQDSYLDTAGGTFYIRSIDNSTMGGTIDTIGNMTFDPTGRVALMASFAHEMGEQEWNRDDSQNYFDTTGLYDTWTTGTSTSRHKGAIGQAFTLTGTPPAGCW